jgi:RecB family exonuclease
VATEVPFALELTTPSGPVKLRGYMDRVEIDAEGRVYVVDYKTGRQKLTKPALATHTQLAVYQLAVRHGALASQLTPHLGTGPVRSGGAELVHLRQPDGGNGPLVQAQAPLPDGVTWAHDLLDEAVRTVTAEQFPPRPSDSCRRCAFRGSCPTQPEGRMVIS